MSDVLRKSEHQAHVESFMQQAGQIVRTSPEIPSELERIRIVKLIFEEAKETAIALGISVTAEGQEHSVPVTDCHLTFKADREPNLVEAADGFADLHVVVTSGQSACGIADEALQEMIDASNLAKFEPPDCPMCEGEMHLVPYVDTLVGVASIGGKPADLSQIGTTRQGYWWECKTDKRHEHRNKEAGPYRRNDGKWIKPPYLAEAGYCRIAGRAN